MKRNKAKKKMASESILQNFSGQVKHSWGRIPVVYKHTLYILTGVFILSLFWRIFEKEKTPQEVQKQVKDLIQSASRMYAISSQDTNPIVAYKHINYALANARTAQKYVSNDEELYRLTKVHVPELVHVLEQEQTSTLQKICQTCPMMKPTTMFAGSSGWL